MLYLSQMLGRPVVDSSGVELGKISDIAVQTGEVFPRITSFAFKGPAKTPFMVSWRKYVENYGSFASTSPSASANVPVPVPAITGADVNAATSAPTGAPTSTPTTANTSAGTSASAPANTSPNTNTSANTSPSANSNASTSPNTNTSASAPANTNASTSPSANTSASAGTKSMPFATRNRNANSDCIVLNVPSHNLRFSYLQPDELLLARDLLNKQIVDTQGMKVVRVNDLKLSQSGRQLRLLGAEVGVRGLLRSLSPMLEKFAMGITKLFGSPMEERIIAWNYMELVDRDLSNVKLSVTHKRLHELHPADVADILEQLDPQQRAKVFDHLDAQQAAQTMSELGDEFQTDIIGEMAESEASELLASMDPDDAADILGDLPYEKAEKLLWLMGVQDQRRIRALLGYKDKTAGGIMTPETVTVSEDATVAEVIEKIRTLSENEDLETVHYVYLLGQTGELSGALSLRSLVLATPDTKAAALATRDLVTAGPDTDQEEVAELISKYDLLAVPVVDEGRHLLGIVTVDDAMDVIEEEHVEDLTIAGAGTLAGDEANTLANKLKWLLRRGMWLVLWTVVALMVLMSGGFALFASALVLVPFVLVFADNTVTLSINDLLDYDGTKSAQSTRRLLVRNTIIALLLAVIGIAAAVLLRGAFASAQINDTETWGILSALAAALITVVAVMLLAVLVTMRGRRQLDKGRSLSNTTTTLLIMLLSLGMQFALTYAFHGIIVL